MVDGGEEEDGDSEDNGQGSGWRHRHVHTERDTQLLQQNHRLVSGWSWTCRTRDVNNWSTQVFHRIIRCCRGGASPLNLSNRVLRSSCCVQVLKSPTNTLSGPEDTHACPHTHVVNYTHTEDDSAQDTCGNCSTLVLDQLDCCHSLPIPIEEFPLQTISSFIGRKSKCSRGLKKEPSHSVPGVI